MKTDSIAPSLSDAHGGVATQEAAYEHEETRELVALVDDAAGLIKVRGEDAFADFRAPDALWRHKESYVFVLDPEGKMLVHPDPELEGRNTMDLRDIAGRPIVRGLIEAATHVPAGGEAWLPEKGHGWFHYEWPVQGEILPRWKSSYVRLVKAPSGKSYIVGSGMYNDRMERAFVVDAVMKAVHAIEQSGEAAFALLRDPTGQYRVKDSYVFVVDENGIELVCPPFPSLEGQYVRDVQDTQGKFLNQELLKMIREHGSGWVDYMWPRPGEAVSTRKSTFVSKAMLNGRELMVGCGVYLAGAPREQAPATPKITAPELMTLVREAAAILSERGADFYPELRRMGSKWYHDDTYCFVYRMDGTRVVQATEPQTEGHQFIDLTDVLGRPIVKMALDAVSGPSGEGWVHYQYPLPGGIFPTWKSSFVKRGTYPSGEQFMVGSGAYDMQMDRSMIEDLVERAAALMVEQGENAFHQLRDRKGPFVFMDTYVFVQTPDGTELVNPMQPALEGRNLMDLEDLQGKKIIRDEIEAAMSRGNAWVEMYWYRPGDNVPARKLTYVKRVDSGGRTYIVGSGIYLD